MGRFRVAVDTGGTFSDFVYFDEERRALSIAKLPSTPRNPADAILAGVQGLLDEGVTPAEIVFFLHGTTVGTNAMLEEKGARTGLLITRGFRGVYEVGEQMRGYGPAMFDFHFHKPPPLARPRETYEVTERLDPSGAVLQPIDLADVERAAERLRAQGVESVAICFLFAFRNPAHEQAAAAVLRQALPEVPVSLSSDVLPQIREYYRLSTTVINAYIRPILTRYLGQLGARLDAAGVRTPQRYLMQSNGGVASFTVGAERAVTTILSGPAGGVMAGIALGRTSGYQDLVTFDMGGTSCDVALIHHGQPSVAALSTIGGRHIAVPMLDINTVSAGGGTIARVEDTAGLQQVRVGPDSAGALPGPVCYGQGGDDPTITDADLTLGYLNPDNFVGGGLRLDRPAAVAAIERKIAAPLGLDVLRAADGIVRIIDVKMQEAVKAISTRRGHDLRDFTLVAFGGAGPVHASRVARELGMARVLVPLYPGCTSALGLLTADVRHDYVRSQLDAVATLDLDSANAIFADLEAQARAELAAEGFGATEVRLERHLDFRYAGQGYEVRVPAPDGPLTAASLAATRRAFDQTHEQQFGHAAPDEPTEIVNYRVIGYGLVPKVELPTFPPASGPAEAARVGTRRAYFGELGAAIDCPIYNRSRLAPGHTLVGPCIVEQLDSTTVVLPEQRLRVDAYGNLVLEWRDGRDG
ncbi:MAG TPA: hydantoinase/oxoprolinase family protein [Chloroflexota bacterium]|nr:hydantoinase/oxoprolinase family protein [Chloroflexota bacterium]